MKCSGYTMLPNGIYKIFMELDLSLFLVMYQIYCYNRDCKNKNSFETTYRYLLQELGLSQESHKTLQKSLEYLIDTGVLIRISKGVKGKGSVYTIDEDKIKELLDNKNTENNYKRVENNYKGVSQPCYNTPISGLDSQNKGVSQPYMTILDNNNNTINNITSKSSQDIESLHYLFEKKVIPKTSQDKILLKYKIYRYDHLEIDLEEVKFSSMIQTIKFQHANIKEKTGAILNWIFQGIDEERLYHYLKSLNIEDIDKVWRLAKEEINNY